MNYLENQLKLVKKPKEHAIIFIVLFLAIFSLFFYNRQKASYEKKFIASSYSYPSGSRFKYEKDIVIDDMDFSNQSLHQTFINKKTQSELYSRYYNLSKALKNNNYPNLLNDELDNLKIYQKDSERSIKLSHPDGQISADDIPFKASGGKIDLYLKAKEKINHRLMKDHLKPESTRYGTSGSLFIISLLNYLTSFLGIFVVTWYGIRAVGKKYEGNQHRLFKTTSLSNWKIVICDYFVFILNSLIFLAVCLTISVVITTLNGEKFNGSYPILVRLKGNITLIPASSYIIQVIIIFLFVLSITFLISYLLVRILKSSFMSVFLSSMFIGLCFNLAIIEPISSYNPALYFQPTQIYIGHSLDKIKTDGVTIFNGNSENLEYVSSDFVFENTQYYQGESLEYQFNSRGLHFGMETAIISLLGLVVLLFGINIAPMRKLQ